jgi:hypothetical protein
MEEAVDVADGALVERGLSIERPLPEEERCASACRRARRVQASSLSAGFPGVSAAAIRDRKPSRLASQR